MKKIIILYLLFSFFSLPVFAAEQKKLLQFITLADIHFDPFIVCYQKRRPCQTLQLLRQAPVSEWPSVLAKFDHAKPIYRSNTNYPLLISALNSAKQVTEKNSVQFVLVLGDFLAHDFRSYYQRYARDNSNIGYQEFVKKTMQFITNELNKTFTRINVFPIIGNNDSYHGDYVTVPNGLFFRDLQQTWSSLIKNPQDRAAMQASFARGGYYGLDIPNYPNLRLIVLNSVLFSAKSQGPGVEQAALQELTWLHEQLSLAKTKKQNVLIATHIPPGIDIYASLQYRLLRLLELWKIDYIKRFEKELHEFAPEILGIFAGHLHTDWFQIMTLDDIYRIPVTGTPSISPIYGNNPGFKLYSYSIQSQRFVNFETYYYSIERTHRWSKESYLNRFFVRDDHKLASEISCLEKPAGSIF